MKKIIFIITLFIEFSLSAQVTIIVEELPERTPKNASIFISGDFEGWSGGKKEYKLEYKNDHYTITLPKELKQIQYKFTQGSWNSVECDMKGLSIENRSYTFNKLNDTLKVKIVGWDNLFDKKINTTASKNVTVLAKDFEIPQLNRKRRVWLYLPPGYEKSNESYPVVYMHDGQNLFDANTSFSGEWSVDETLNKLFNEKNLKLIVVGIDNGGSKRLDEYSPWTNEKYGGGEGEAYLEFIVNTLKPYIDRNYKTRTGKKNTGIIGSSMGGLISHYGGLKYPEVFGKVGVYSPAFWFAPEINEFSKEQGNVKDSKIYFLAGGKEGNNTTYKEINQTVDGMNSMINILKTQGFPIGNIRSKVVPNGKHNEELWRNNFEETILWLFPNAIKERTFVDAEFTNNQLHINVSDGAYHIKFYAPKIAETTFVPKGEVNKNKESHAVVLKSTFSGVSYKENDSLLLFKSKGLSVLIKKNPFNISYWHNGEKVISEKKGYVRNDSLETIQFNLNKDEVLYGGGARALGMNRRGHRLELYNKAHYGYETESKLMNFTLPIVLSSKRYMIHFDNAPIGFLDLDSKQDNTLTYETISGRKTYQVVVGESWLDLLKNYTSLTGTQPIPPRWALGNFASRFGYHSQAETEAVIAKFKAEKIPVDAVILDLYWFGKEMKGTMGNLQVHTDSFPDMKAMTANFKKQGVKTIVITEPFVLTTSKRWEDAVEQEVLAKDSVGNPYRFDFYFGNTGLIDIYNPKGKQWFWNIYKDIANLGVDGIWGDLGEPEVHPSKLLHATGTADEVHNIYGHDWARLIQDGYKKDFSNKRPFILMRAGAAGSQRFGMIPWSGDVNRTWGGLQSQTEIALQMTMQGLAYMHSDLGGFAGSNLDDELYVRWLQYGVFQPIYRPHAQEEVPAEPVFRSEKAKALAKEAIELRYKLLPYNYTMAFYNSKQGSPLMQPLLFEEPNNKALLTNASTYLWGKDILVTPVVKQGVSTVEMYFPKTNNWFDFYTGKKVNGGQTQTISTNENTIPTYVRGGAFIPMAKPMQSTTEYEGNTFDLHYYYDASVKESTRELYNDDGETSQAYKKQQYELLTFKAETKKRELIVAFEAELGAKYSASIKYISVVLHNIEKEPKRIKINGNKVVFNWDANSKTITFPMQWETSEAIKAKIKF